MGSGRGDIQRNDAGQVNLEDSSHSASHWQSMQELGIDQCVIMPGFTYNTATGDKAIRDINDQISHYAAANEFVVGSFAIVDPLAMEDPDAEAHRVVSELGCLGLAWHNRFQRVWMNADPVKRLIRACPEETRLIACHCVAESHMEAVWRLEELLYEFPERKFLAMSVFTAHSQCSEIIQVAARHSNLYVEIGGMVPLGLWIEEYVDKVGSDRLLFGTDLYTSAPLFRHNYAKALVDNAHISEQDRELIYSGNILRLLRGDA
jgi:hypothetical protein